MGRLLPTTRRLLLALAVVASAASRRTWGAGGE